MDGVTTRGLGVEEETSPGLFSILSILEGLPPILYLLVAFMNPGLAGFENKKGKFEQYQASSERAAEPFEKIDSFMQETSSIKDPYSGDLLPTSKTSDSPNPPTNGNNANNISNTTNTTNANNANNATNPPNPPCRYVSLCPVSRAPLLDYQGYLWIIGGPIGRYSLPIALLGGLVVTVDVMVCIAIAIVKVMGGD